MKVTIELSDSFERTLREFESGPERAVIVRELGTDLAEMADETTWFTTPTSACELPAFPPVATARSYEGASHAAHELNALVFRSFHHAARTSLLEIRAECGVSSEHDPFFSLDERVMAFSQAYARVDFAVSRGTLRALEVNVGSGIGLVPQTTHLVERYLSSAFGIRLARRLWLWAENPASALAERLMDLFSREDAPPVLGLIDLDPGHEAFAAQLACRGIPSVMGLPSQVKIEGSRVRLAGATVDLLFRWYSRHHTDLVAEAGTFAPLLEAAATRRVPVLGDEAATLTSNKRWLAELSEGRTPLSDGERAFVRALVPWTRRVTQGSGSRTVTPPGESGTDPAVPLAELLSTQRRTSFVLKPECDSGGRGVLIGKSVDAAVWEATVNAILSGTAKAHVVQEYVPSDELVLPFLREGALVVSRRAFVLGTFVIGTRRGATAVRLAPGVEPGVISGSKGATVVPLIAEGSP